MILRCKMFVVFYTVKIVYICVFMNCSTSYCLGDALQIHGMCDVCIILLSHNGYLLIFCIAKGLKCHVMCLLQCCLIGLYIVLNSEIFFLHMCFSFHCLIWSVCQWQKCTTHSTCSARARTHAHTHKHILAFSWDCQRV